MKFFFITLTIEGREKILSKLISEQSRPALTHYGEVVKATLIAMHGEFPCVTISDFVIMPDHLHFIMIVDYSKNRFFSPLWAAHRLMDATEAIWVTNGDFAPEPQKALAEAITLAHKNLGSLTISNRSLTTAIKWNRHCYIELSFDSQQLKTIRRYIRLNPARAIWKASHPNRFICFSNIKHPILDPSRSWDAMGNLTLLGSPFLHHVRLTMSKTTKEHSLEINKIINQTQQGLIPVCGFISPGEKELLRHLKTTPNARFIKIIPFALPPHYDPSAEDSRELAADRMLILSGFPQGTIDTRQNLRTRCNIMNNLAAKLCTNAQILGTTQ